MYLNNESSDLFKDDQSRCKGYEEAYKIISDLRAKNKQLNENEWLEMRKCIAYSLDMNLKS